MPPKLPHHVVPLAGDIEVASAATKPRCAQSRSTAQVCFTFFILKLKFFFKKKKRTEFASKKKRIFLFVN